MALLGAFGIVFWSGLALVGVGNLLALRALDRHGGLTRKKLLWVVFDEASPMKQPAAAGDRTKFRVGVFLIGFGLVNLYTSISVGPEREARICDNRCRLAGHLKGEFGEKPAASAGEPPIRTCFCVTPTGSVELEQPDLALPSAPPR